MVRKGDFDDAEYLAEFEALKVRIRKRFAASLTAGRRLRRIVKAGADECKLITLLAFVSQSTDNTIVARLIRKQKKSLEGLAAQMEAVARHADRVLASRLSYAGFWLALLGDNDDYQGTAGQHNNPLPKQMRAFAEHLRTEIRHFGWLPRRVQAHRKMYLSSLLLYICETTGESFDQEIAFLLTDAFEANGKSRAFSAEQIKKYRQRHIPRLRACTYFS